MVITNSYQIFNKIYERYDFLNRLLSAGIDQRWRKKLVATISPDAVDILDLATGTGDVALAIRRRFPAAQITGIDPASNMLKLASQKSEKASANVIFSLGNACELPQLSSNSADAITIAFGIRNMASPVKCLRECHRILRSGGSLSILEFGLPQNSILKYLYLGYFRYILPTLGGWISGDKAAYSYLNSSVEHFAYAGDFCELMIAAGFATPTHSPLTGGIAYLYRGNK